eukprot:TRINITY_DN110300_c0_g1_i1.p1 TRINITY_DN110300_c0_g1~~TRINITY_DN110300_c0_g1_i1.p1  ORF type:complete len:211 (-),score=73.11 TRINITY_DN110300_c0_g1_i1:90-722(-)
MAAGLRTLLVFAALSAVIADQPEEWSASIEAPNAELASSKKAALLSERTEDARLHAHSLRVRQAAVNKQLQIEEQDKAEKESKDKAAQDMINAQKDEFEAMQKESAMSAQDKQAMHLRRSRERLVKRTTSSEFSMKVTAPAQPHTMGILQTSSALNADEKQVQQAQQAQQQPKDAYEAEAMIELPPKDWAQRFRLQHVLEWKAHHREKKH